MIDVGIVLNWAESWVVLKQSDCYVTWNYILIANTPAEQQKLLFLLTIQHYLMAHNTHFCALYLNAINAGFNTCLAVVFVQLFSNTHAFAICSVATISKF